jgi:pimeloyl-ACP methyl ester carboxylesterase
MATARGLRSLRGIPLGLTVAVALLAACTTGQTTGPVVDNPPTSTHRPAPALHDTGSCAPNQAGFACSTLTVPLDHADPEGTGLVLHVAVQDIPSGEAGQRPILLFLTGGPGQPGVSYAARTSRMMAPVLTRYRLVMIDQRGTGGTALNCPGLQQQMAETDLIPPTQTAVEECSSILGQNRGDFSTAQTVQDLDWLRRALGVKSLAIDGISYGTYVAENYAMTFPHHVDHLVLDSVVPHVITPAGSMQLASFRAVRRVLPMVCKEQGCTTDPVADLAWLVRHRGNGPELLDLLAITSIIRPDLAFVPRMLHQARLGDDRELEGWLHGIASDVVPIDQFSQGLHAAALCADQDEPWGGPDTPLAAREATLDRLNSQLTTAQTYPFDTRTATGNGFVQVCRWWGVTQPPPEPRQRDLPPVPTLFLIGDHDLCTPLEWAHHEVDRSPDGQMVLVKGAGHSIQPRGEEFPGTMKKVFSFLGNGD